MKTFAAFVLVALLGCVSRCNVQGCSSSKPIQLTFAVDFVACNQARFDDIRAALSLAISEYSESYSGSTFSLLAIYADIQVPISGFTDGVSLIAALDIYWDSYTYVNGDHAPCVRGALSYLVNHVATYASSIVVFLVNGVVAEVVDDLLISDCQNSALELIDNAIEIVALQLTLEAGGSGSLDGLLGALQTIVRNSCGQADLQTFFNSVSFVAGCNNSLFTLIHNLLGWILCGVFSLLYGLLGGLLGVLG